MQEQRQDGLMLAPGQLYGERYRIVMPIGKGGMGRVYLAEDIRLGGKTRALKLTRPLQDERMSFLPEAQLLSELDHPHLPAIVDYYPPNEEGVACIVMDYIAGDTLAERWERFGFRLPFPFVLGVLTELCEVLVYLHAQTPAIVFRDLKPANVLLDRHNKAMLVDFGIARRYRDDVQFDTLQLGTPGFAAPEQLRGDQSDGRTDLYGIGALAYFLLTGGQFAIRHRGELKRVLQEDVPSEFIFLLERLLASQPAARPQSATELYGDFIAIHQQINDHPLSQRQLHSLILDPYQAHEYGNQDRTIVIGIASAYPGAGATFASLALSSALSGIGIPHALVECPGNDSELYTLLNGARKMPRGAVYAHANGLQATAPAWRNGKAAYYPLDPNEFGTQPPETAFASWLRKLGAPIVLLDLSSNWGQTHIRDWLTRAVDHLIMVADCYPAKWSGRRQASCMELLQLALQRNIKNSWIANRDQPFADRKQWLSLFPVKPDVYLPDLGGPTMLHSLWRGEGITSEPHAQQTVHQAFQRWIDSYAKSR
ncbi:serine/threonine protein kinase [Cohnella mopanensis]|uniref:serine/threonine protein kinase n=1 Tax=Cohnella mopanensis TaxID=2911966 RepID=UPI001EF7AF43|nr:serine/threonine-protein kinase [Cohnella mopanensis]